jgi:hypothetical protein
MNEASLEPRDRYSPHLRTALVLVGAGTAGAYHAGVLRAFHEAGVKVDVVAGRGMGAVSAAYEAIDGASRLWEPDGLWRGAAVGRTYRWRRALRVAGWAAAAALSLVLVPFALLSLGLLVYPLAFLLGVVGSSAGSSMAAAYASLVERWFQPGYLIDLLPKGLVLSLTALVAVLAVIAIAVLTSTRDGRRHRAAIWWRVIGSPIESSSAVTLFVSGLWKVVGGIGGGSLPAGAAFNRAYTELLADNLGQPAFRELLITVHDVDLRRDLVFALVTDRHRREFFRRRPGSGGERRAAEVFDLSAVGRDHFLDALAGALCMPVIAGSRPVRFAPESYWRGEVHRLVDRPAATARLIEELSFAGVEQVIVVSAFSEIDGPHGLTVARGDLRGCAGEYLAGAEAAGVRDAVTAAADVFTCVFHIKPAHVSLGPLDVRGCYDEHSDRRLTLGELVDRGYQDAYRQFIDPIVGAGGEQIQAGQLRPLA